ncbi:response regulator transcription factor [Serratia fonticola]|uniref:response regulator transcription factor n=1 Tax=Serratia fonticola TaxID=47917 RepID=UPI0034C62C80
MAASAKTIKVLIIDKNSYFIAGLRHIILDVYRNQDITVQFIDRNMLEFSADIIFQAIDYGAMFNVWRHLPSGGPTPSVFLIRDQRNSLLSHIFKSVRKNGTLYRNQTIDVVKSMLEEEISVQGYQPPSITPGNVATQGLTLREGEVLRYLRQGKSHVETANVMRLHVKTVSSHKRSAMRKLNFKRNHELFHWLLQGGLTSVGREI